jgi:hypothetical protein
MKKLCGALLVMGLCVGGCSDSKPDLREGKWQITAAVEMKGVPFKMPPMVYEECLTQDDIIPSPEDTESGCALTGPHVDGNTVSWKSVCDKGDGSVATSDGSVTYAGEMFSGKITIQIGGENPMVAVNTLSGKYIGECDE